MIPLSTSRVSTSRSPRSPWASLLGVLLLASLATPTLADDAAPAGRDFFERIEVHVLDLEVVVTDRDGGRVTGLRPEDFRVEIDGDPVPVDYFREVRDRRPVGGVTSGGEGSAGEPAAADDAAGQAAAPAVGAAEPVNFLVFVDKLTGFPPHQAQAMKVLEEQLDELRPEDRVTFVSFTGNKLERHGDWTSDRLELARQVAAVNARRAGGGIDRTQLAALDGVEDPFDHGDVSMLSRSEGSLEGEIVRISRRVSSVYQAAAATVAAYSGLPGRNVMILVSGLWPRDVDVYVAGSQVPLTVRAVAGDHDPEVALERLVAAANLAGFTLYPIDTGGKEPAYGNALERERVDWESIDGATQYFDKTYGRENETESSLLEIAAETGGKALMDQQRESAFSTIVADVASFYSLGVTLERVRDGEDHRVKVAVLRPGLEARSRRGFTDFARVEEVEMAVEGALLLGEPISRPLVVQVSQPELKRRRRIELPVRLTIPLDEVAMLPRGGRFEAHLELRVASLEPNGQRSDLETIPIQFGGEKRPEKGQVVYYDTTLQLRAIEQRLVLALHDTVGDSLSSTVFDLQPPPNDAGR